MMQLRPGETATSRPDPIRRPVQLSLEVASYVRELILSGQVHANEPLNIDSLARTLSISTTPVREGLLALRGEGFVRFEPRRGFRVSPLSRVDIADLYWAQAQIAGELSARAAKMASQDLVAELRRIQADMRVATERGAPDRVEALNHEFHRAIHRATDSSKLAWLLGVALRYAPRRFYGSIPGFVEASIHDHQAVLEAIERRDGPAARAAVAEHFIHAGQLLIENLERRGFWAESDPCASRTVGKSRTFVP